MTTKTFGMFSVEGNYMVARIAEAGKKLAQTDGSKSAWAFAHRELTKLGYTNQFGEATDTDVREQVYDFVTAQCEEGTDFYI